MSESTNPDLEGFKLEEFDLEGFIRSLDAIIGRRPTVDPRRRHLMNTGWVSLGLNRSTGAEGWGKMIDGKAVMVDQPEALVLAGWKE